jgi:hypothetical protein
MIVWGGSGDSSKLNTGGRYVPGTNTWAPTSTGPGVPDPRHFHTATWTGSELIVWGGTGDTPLDTGGRYAPAAEAWTATPTGANAPAPRYRHTAVWTGEEMIVWGGEPMTTEVGLYCAAGCAVPTTFWRDVDGDGHGDPAKRVEGWTCAPPAGFAANDDDCDDSNAATYPHAPEVKDGEDNQCAGDCAEGVSDCGWGVVDEVAGAASWSGTTFCWSPQAGATSYEVVRSPEPGFLSSCAVFDATRSECIDDPSAAGPGGAYYYLVRSLTPAPPGSWGQSSGGQERTGGCLPSW